MIKPNNHKSPRRNNIMPTSKLIIRSLVLLPNIPIIIYMIIFFITKTRNNSSMVEWVFFMDDPNLPEKAADFVLTNFPIRMQKIVAMLFYGWLILLTV